MIARIARWAMEQPVPRALHCLSQSAGFTRGTGTRRGGLLLGLTVAVGLVAVTWQGPGTVSARLAGVTGHSGNPGTNRGATCTACHSGGRVPDVTFEGPPVVVVGATNTYTLTIAGGQRSAGGLDVSATRGLLDILAGAKDVQLVDGEITHTEPKRGDRGGRVAFAFQWTAPDSPGKARLYGAGNSVNLNDSPLGDAPDTATLIIDVEAARTPTPFPTVESPYAVVAAGLANPHGLAIPAGNDLLVGEGGSVGSVWKPGQFAPGAGDGRVLRIDLGAADQRTPLVERMTNAVDPGGGVVGGNHAIQVRLNADQGGESTLILVAQGGGPSQARPAEAAKILQVDAGGAVSVFADTLAFERAMNPDGAAGESGLDSNPWRLIAGPAGTVYVVDAGANDILTLDLATRQLATWALFPELAAGQQAIPTSLVFAPEDPTVAYVSLLGPFAGTTEMRRLHDLNRDGDMLDAGEQSVLISGLKLVTDLALGPGGHLYFTQIADGTLWRIDPACWSPTTACGASERVQVADRLPGASGLAFTAEGDALVSTTNQPNPAGISLNTNQIVRVPHALIAPPQAPTQSPPAATPTATVPARTPTPTPTELPATVSPRPTATAVPPRTDVFLPLALRGARVD